MCTTLAASPDNHMSPETSGLQPQKRALSYWASAFIFGNLASAMVYLALEPDASTETVVRTSTLAASAFCMWAVFGLVAQRFCAVNNTTLRNGFSLAITKRDWLVGIPVGLASQFVLVNVVTWPFTRLFPDAFAFDEVSRRATELTDQAQGLWIVVLVLVVVIGAPIAEEILYRGVLQNGATAQLGVIPGLVTTAAIFALVHFSPVEIPGLFAFALVLGLLRKNSGRLGLPIVAHMAFNVAGLLLVTLV
jgi:uncharacterized protein